MLTSKEFANILRKMESPTPYTIGFEEQRNKTGERKYAQKNNRWWDNSTGMQKEHVTCWFSRKYYSNGSTKECIEENLNKICTECYFKENKKPHCKQEKDAKKVFNDMGKPEMYLWVAETLNAVEELELENCIRELKSAMDENSLKWKSVINEYITWEKIENKIFQIVELMEKSADN